MISIRLSNDEYEAIRAHYGGSSELSVSEFVRSALMHSLGLPNPELGPPVLQAEIATLHGRIDRLEQRIDRLVEFTGLPKP